jgi:biotin synthase-related radical SAM superfamily protein
LSELMANAHPRKTINNQWMTTENGWCVSTKTYCGINKNRSSMTECRSKFHVSHSGSPRNSVSTRLTRNGRSTDVCFSYTRWQLSKHE